MVPWSENVMKQLHTLIPKKLDVSDFIPAFSSFPFENTPKTITQTQAATAVAEGKIVNHDPSQETRDVVKVAPFIEVGEDYVTFRMQRGPIKDYGVIGCQIDDLIKFCADTITVLNKKFSCRENSLAITKLEEAWLWCQARKLDREARHVEGHDKD